MPTILVTGGAGFIGGCFVRRLLRTSTHEIVNLDALTYAGNLDSLGEFLDHPRHHFVKGSIGDSALLNKLFREHNPAAVVHFAAESHVDRSIGAPAEFLHTNVLGTFRLLEAALAHWNTLAAGARDSFRFVHVSTDEVYGSLGAQGKFREDTAYAPNSPYSASKASSDHFVRAYHHTYGLPVLTTNCSNNYGPYQFPEKLIPLMILNAMEGKPLPVYGDGCNIRDWLHVEDHCQAIEAVWQRGVPGEVYNIGGNAERTNLQVVGAICQAVDELLPGFAQRPTKNLIKFVTDRPGHDRRYAIDAGKIERELGWLPQTQFELGIRQTVQWYLDNQPWVERVTSGKYQRERLGLRGTAAAPATARPASRPAAAYQPGPIAGIELRPLTPFRDRRGWLIEVYRDDELAADFHPAMAYVSQTEPGVARGPHEHVDQADYFAFLGPGDFELFLWDSRPDSATYGHSIREIVGESNPRAVIVPAGVVHAYRNVSPHAGWVFNAPNRLYAGPGKHEPVDEIRHEDEAGSPYQLPPLEQNRP